MKVNVIFSPVIVDELFYTGKTTVVIDVLRATSTIITAFQNGVKEIIPVASVEFAVKVSGGMFGGHTLLCGERNTKKIEGFALGNSPLEYSKENVEGKSVVFYTTNGSKAIVKAKFSEHLLIASYLNMNAIAEHILKIGNDVEILCAGRNGNFSFEDIACAGRLVNVLKNKNKKIELTDSSKVAAVICDHADKDLSDALKQTEHGKLLHENGFEDDLEYCAKTDITDVISYYHGSVLKKL